ncbi:hypothetical protein D3C83_183180 [compost metagenome]
MRALGALGLRAAKNSANWPSAPSCSVGKPWIWVSPLGTLEKLAMALATSPAAIWVSASLLTVAPAAMLRPVRRA